MQSIYRPRCSSLLNRVFHFKKTVRFVTTCASPQVLQSKTKWSTPHDQYLKLQTRCMCVSVQSIPQFTKHMMGYTENNSPTYLSSGNPCLDFFFHVVPHSPSDEIVQHLESSWAHDPLTTLKLICNLRGVKGTGKSDKESFYTAALWLHENHYKNLACNVSAIASFGYLKDTLEILFRLLEGSEARSVIKKEWESRKGKWVAPFQLKLMRRTSKPISKGQNMKKLRTMLPNKLRIKGDEDKLKKLRALVPREERVKENEKKMMEASEKASILRKETRLARSEKLKKLYNNDMCFQFLYEKISSLFADMLKADMECFDSGKMNHISLAAKWCPSLHSSYDEYTFICESIAKKVFPRESYPEYEGIEDAHYAYRARDRLRKQVLVPLRRALELPEVYMSANEWSSVAYNRVASVAMKNYTDTFNSHDKERFSKYLEDVEQGKAKIAAGALLPHDIISSCVNADSPEQRNVAELQWKRMVDDMLKKGKLTNSIAVSDVSSSMNGTPMDVSVALGLLVSELSEVPWKGQVITFSNFPRLHLIKGTSLLEKSKFIRRMDWGYNTNFQRVFDQIFKVAVTAKLTEEQMVKRLFVFSDMEFDQASCNPWETDYKVIQKKFKESGYENVPEIVFWNLRHSSATPVTVKQNGVALVSGFSKNLLNIFMDQDGEINPELVMERAISGKEYRKLALYDD